MKSLSTSIAFIILLFFTANVAGADTWKCPGYKITIEHADGTHDCIQTINEAIGFKSEESDAEISPNCVDGSDGSSICRRPKSDAEKWRLICESAMNNLLLINNSESNHDQVITQQGFVTSYCTRYNGALLEEIRNK